MGVEELEPENGVLEVEINGENVLSGNGKVSHISMGANGSNRMGGRFTEKGSSRN